MSAATAPRPLAEADDRDHFDCGRESLNIWFRRHAWAVDKAHQGRRHAASLLRFALVTALRASEIVGNVGVITHPLDDGVRGFYASWGFKDLPFDPRRAMLIRTSALRTLFATDIAATAPAHPHGTPSA